MFELLETDPESVRTAVDSDRDGASCCRGSLKVTLAAAGNSDHTSLGRTNCSFVEVALTLLQERKEKEWV